MNYQKIYNSIIARARDRMLDVYTESHHILPRSMGGGNGADNLVDLTAREHFVAHILLAKIYGGKMWHAAHMMSNMKRYSSRTYSRIREEHAKLVGDRMRGKVMSEETKAKLSESRKGHSWNKGIPKTEDHVRNWKDSRAAGAGWVCPEHKKEKQKAEMVGEGNPMFGKTHDEEARRKISEANKVKVICPHCGKQGGIAIMKRWHFSKCKTLDSNSGIEYN